MRREDHLVATAPSDAAVLCAGATMFPRCGCRPSAALHTTLVAQHWSACAGRHPRRRFFLALDLAHVLPRSFAILGAMICPKEVDGDYIGRHIVPAFDGAGEPDDAWPGLRRVLGEGVVHPSDVAGVRVADVGQVRRRAR